MQNGGYNRRIGWRPRRPDILATICDRRVDGLGGVFFCGDSLIGYLLTLMFSIVDKGLKAALVSNYVVSYHVEVSRNLLNLGSPSMPAKSPGPVTGMFFDSISLFRFFIPPGLTGALAGPGGHTRLFYT